MKILRVLPLVLCLLGISSFASAQTPLTPEIEVSSAEPGFDILEFDAAMNARGDFVVLWSGLRPAPPGTLAPALFVRGFAADGTPRTEAILVSEEPASANYHSAVAIRDDGTFLAVYKGGGPDGPSRLKGRLFAPDGTPLGDVFPVTNSFFAGAVSVAPREDGGFIVAWTDIGQVAYRLLSPEGERVGPERALGFGAEASVAAGPGNEMVVVWQNWNPENAALQAVTVQRLRPDGTRRGRKLFVSQQRLQRRNSIILPEAAFDSAGKLLVRWSDWGAWIRRYSEGGAALGRIRQLPDGAPSSGIVMDDQGNFTLARVLSRPNGSVQDLVVQRFHQEGFPLGPAVYVTSSWSIWDSAIVGNEAGDLVLLWTRDTHIRAKVFSAE
ncbi:MAG TPA: hypothetical protein VJ725_17825 [Thermoanaerobaculia bacterium]|nr:hypothetical protein [Thermoanaerobaculia bacterium]